MNQHRDDNDRADREPDWFDRELSEHQLPKPRRAFRQEMQDAFVSGEFPERENCEAFRTELRKRFVSGKVRSKPRVPRLLRVLLPVAAAVALIFTQLPIGIGGTQGWEILEVVEDASVLGAIADWQEIHTSQDRLRLGYGNDVFVEIGASSLVQRTNVGGERLNAKEGSLVFTASEGEQQITFLIETPDAVVQISSNSVGVDVYDEGTCVCVLSGEVIVTPRIGESESVSIGPGRACFIQRDGTLRIMEGLQESHSSPIEELRKFAELRLATD